MFNRSIALDTRSLCVSIATLRQREAKGLAAGLPLMQRAARAATEWIAQLVAPPASVLVLVGPGNNGGDALVTARLLVQAGFRVQALMPARAALAPDDAQQALADWQSLGRLTDSTPPDQAPDLVVDGLFGIGLSRALEEPFQDLIDTVNAWQVPVLALDIATGLDAETGQPLGRPIRATHTLAFLAACHAFAAPSAQPFLGQCRVARLDT